ncbi:MAG: sulfurtransferase [Gammaproteobacteria bacterium]|nr:sulfurtransferase [Gammaproteobacteria bacterium]
MNPVDVLLEIGQFDAVNETHQVVLVDLRSQEQYAENHLPGAVHLPYATILKVDPPVGGLLPDADAFNGVLRSLGITRDHYVVAYDAEGGAAAGRLIWTLHAYDFYQCGVLHGGINAWVAAGRELTTASPEVAPSTISLQPTATNVISVDELKARIGDDKLGLLDARTLDEYTGAKVRANHGGRIPGAERLEWTDALDPAGPTTLLPDETLRDMLDQRGLTPDKDIVVYCQTHHRSALSYLMLKHLGYESVTALDGAWSAWGNRDDTPKETG